MSVIDDRNEAETRAELIDPALRDAGWGVVDGSRVRREVITLGRLQGAGTRSKQEIADYVLVYHNQKLAVIEAKREKLGVTEGLGQAKQYAGMLQTPFTYATNGHGLYQVNVKTGVEGDVERYPTPDELWEAVYGVEISQEQLWRKRFPPSPSRTRAASGSPATISTTPSRARWKRWHPARIACYSPWPRAQVRRLSPSRSPGNSSTAAGI
jgi:type I restriction enzyme R subunit